MADEALARAGLHFDELNKIRVLEPEVSQQTTELKEECKDFVDKIDEFQKIVGTFIEVVDNVSKEVEKEKMKVILRIQYEALQKEESEQNEFIEQFILQ
ncbi:hypothetical protein KUTeg_009939, partial [Tegillarca granosa]